MRESEQAYIAERLDLAHAVLVHRAPSQPSIVSFAFSLSQKGVVADANFF